MPYKQEILLTSRVEGRTNTIFGLLRVIRRGFQKGTEVGEVEMCMMYLQKNKNQFGVKS